MSDRENNRKLLIALNSARDISRDSICRLANHLGEWTASRDPLRDLARRLRVPPADIQKARLLLTDRSRAQQEIEGAAALGSTILTLLDEGYPDTLRQLDLPPPVLYCAGHLPDRPCIAIVGSRQATQLGLETAQLFGRELAACGLVVVSGFARGIDLAAHRGALEACGGLTIAVLGCGLDFDYPRRRRRIRQTISRQGALVSEFPLGARPAKLNFPIRNRIIAALSIGTLVVQATPRSGSLITARQALDLGRDVYAVPGSIFDSRSAGPNSLIRDGALLVQHPSEIVESLPLAAREALTHTPGEPPTSTVEGPAAELLRDLEPGQPVTLDRLASQSGKPVDQLQTLLLELEISGHIRRLPGAAFCRRP